MDTWEAIEELARGGLRGDEAAARQLFDLAVPGLIVRATRRRSFRWIVREALRVEARQDCLLRVWERRKEYRGTTAPEFYSWFNRICDTRAVSVWRRVRRRREDTLELSHEVAQATEAPLENNAGGLDFNVRAALDDCLQLLRREDPNAFDVASLIYFVGLSMADIQNVLVRPRATLYQQRKRAHEALADCLDSKGVRSV